MHGDKSTATDCVKCKIIFLGNSGVGKTSIISTWMNSAVDGSYNATIGIDLLKKDVTFKNTHYRLHLWDTAGQEKYKSIVPAFLKQAQCAVLVYDICDQISFQQCESWLKIFHQYSAETSGCVLVGNKADLDANRKVTTAQSQKWANDQTLGFCEVSAKTGEGLDMLLHSILENISLLSSTAASTQPDTSRHLADQSLTRKKIVIKKASSVQDCCRV